MLKQKKFRRHFVAMAQIAVSPYFSLFFLPPTCLLILLSLTLCVHPSLCHHFCLTADAVELLTSSHLAITCPWHCRRGWSVVFGCSSRNPCTTPPRCLPACSTRCYWPTHCPGSWWVNSHCSPQSLFVDVDVLAMTNPSILWPPTAKWVLSPPGLFIALVCF